MDAEQVRQTVKENYAKVARERSSCCGGSCGPRQVAKSVGYSDEDVSGVAADANLGLGCGNPTALAELKEGEVVVDLGSGAGFDALLAAPKLGASGRFIGVDMTPEMLARARTNAVEAGFAETVEFREGVIEELPIASDSVDVIISNCVINLSPDKPRVFREAFRILKPGGRLAISDIVLSEPLPAEVGDLVEAWSACIAGALVEDDYLGAIRDAGFVDVSFERKSAGCLFDASSDDPLVRQAVDRIGDAGLKDAMNNVHSYSIRARKP